MGVIYLLLGASVCMAVFFLAAFVLSVRNGQFDDAYTPSVRMLFDDELTENTNNNQDKSQKE